MDEVAPGAMSVALLWHEVAIFGLVIQIYTDELQKCKNPNKPVATCFTSCVFVMHRVLASYLS